MFVRPHGAWRVYTFVIVRAVVSLEFRTDKTIVTDTKDAMRNLLLCVPCMV